ncbi:hypothetical protein J3R30DRAFT_3278775 [Lentinula aciculospora]|uniref:F-box domain-containing protein n=1 Tax=Lentinula aciculospora TaxID=153920 RepID=A0A9W9AVZ8_9AGAR|nr:hypothetical protein J3R30DRAFT_3278775 [Lentinula aciculospora]
MWHKSSQFPNIFPTELVVKILEELDAFSLVRCRSVCRLLRDIIAETARLTYDIELAIAEQEDGTSCSLSAMEKLDLLRNQQARWVELKWSSQKRYPLNTAGLWELFGNVLAQNTLDGSFVFVQLPSEYRKIPEREWRVKPNTPRFVRDFGMDPSQDLLVLIETPRRFAGTISRYHRIHIRSMSTATRHPLATGTGFIKHLQSSLDISYSIQISMDFLAIFFHAAGLSVNEIVIWEWKSGLMKLHLTGRELRSFCLLSERHILLSLITNQPDGEDQAELLVVDFEKEENHKQSYFDITHGFKLSLPVFHPSVGLRSFTVRSDPSPSWSPRPDLEAPFHKAQDAQIFVASIWVQKNTLRHLTLLIPRSTLLQNMDLSGPMSNESTLAWEAWGPHGSRLMEIHTRNLSFEIWACHVFGTKFVFSECSRRSKQKYTLQVFDFNQKALRNALSQGHKLSESDVLDMDYLECDSSLCVTAPNIFPAGDIFTDEIKTTLPYRWIAKMMPSIRASCSSMCSEDSIIVVDQVRMIHTISHMI